MLLALNDVLHLDSSRRNGHIRVTVLSMAELPEPTEALLGRNSKIVAVPEASAHVARDLSPALLEAKIVGALATTFTCF